ncbi:MAG: DUF4157 domain-containing protein [Akkermansiaceae bacterium]|nr:DUF4157 domain-containing protein [Akkermansiaceae bacterium]
MRSLLYRIVAWMLACVSAPWVIHHQRIIRRDGRALSVGEREIAGQLGVELIDDTYVLAVDVVPNPLRYLSAILEKRSKACISGVDGITLGHGIYVARRVADATGLMAHELVHVLQYERAGSVWRFMVEYIHQCLMHGYYHAAWEIEAREQSARLLR